jgi:hypothetical protein
MEKFLSRSSENLLKAENIFIILLLHGEFKKSRPPLTPPCKRRGIKKSAPL